MDELISKQDAIDFFLDKGMITAAIYIERMPPAPVTLYGYNIKHLALIARVMQKENVTTEKAIECFGNLERMVQIIMDEQKEMIKREAEK